MHRETFLSNLAEKGVNPAYLEMVNVREQCSWVHKEDHEGATLKTLDLIRGAVARARESLALESKRMKVPRGLHRRRRSRYYHELTLTNGMKVHLVEKRPSIGGHMIHPKVFLTSTAASAYLPRKWRR
jgi:heterodisulfide reductase subunit A